MNMAYIIIWVYGEAKDNEGAELEIIRYGFPCSRSGECWLHTTKANPVVVFYLANEIPTEEQHSWLEAHDDKYSWEIFQDDDDGCWECGWPLKDPLSGICGKAGEYDPDAAVVLQIALPAPRYNEMYAIGGLCGTREYVYGRHAVLLLFRLLAAGIITHADVDKERLQTSQQVASGVEVKTTEVPLTQAEYVQLQHVAQTWGYTPEELLCAAALTLPIQLVRGTWAMTVATLGIVPANRLHPYRERVYTAVSKLMKEQLEGTPAFARGSSFLAPVRLFLQDLFLPLPSEICAASEEEVRQLEIQMGVSLPGAHREFLCWMGHGADRLLLGAEYRINQIMDMQGQVASCIQHNQAQPLPSDAVVFWFVRPSTYALFRLSEGGDPPIYVYEQNRHIQRLERAYDTFSDFLAAHFYIYARIHEERRKRRGNDEV